jgi:DeoR family transcriptional regulator, aga operon transcriptional repressor
MASSHSPTADRSSRWSALLDLLSQTGGLTVAQAVESLGVSQATVRRDFRDLAAQQLVLRTHGGVMAGAMAYDLPIRHREAGDDSAKARVAARAAELVPTDCVIGFNGGTTATATARRLAARPDLASSSRRPSLTVVTNSLNIATEMVLRPFLRCVSLGGVAGPQSYEVSGRLTSMVLTELWLDIVVLGADAVSVVGGATCNHEGEAGIGSLMVQHADQVVVVATGDKVGRTAFARICPASRIHVLVTDNSAPQAAVEDLRAAGVAVVLV